MLLERRQGGGQRFRREKWQSCQRRRGGRKGCVRRGRLTVGRRARHHEGEASCALGSSDS